MGKGGRPTAYKPEYVELAYNYCCLGAQDKDLAKYFKVSKATINGWKHKQPGFLDSIKKGKDVYDLEVMEEALKHRAKGYSHPEDKIFCTSKGKVITIKTTKHYPPDTAALCYWLNNRSDGRYSNKQHIEVDTADKTRDAIIKRLRGDVDG